MTRRERFFRGALFASVVVGLIAALEGGLWRIGWQLPGPADVHGRWAAWHGALMVAGFLGTLISLERAVALRHPAGYAAPFLAGVGGLALVAGFFQSGRLLLLGGSAGLVVLMLVVVQKQRALFTMTMLSAAVFWFMGHLLWLVGQPVPVVTWFWQAFLVLTIAGERLELGRMRRLTRRTSQAFLAVALLYALGVLIVPFAHAVGVRLAGVGLMGLGLWLLQFDIARRTIHMQGLTRFIAACLLPGYAWLLVGGLLALIAGFQGGGLLYDAQLHAVFVGFVFSMIFGHAPIIMPAVLGVPPFYHSRFYAHLVLLHASLIMRVGGDVLAIVPLRRWGGLLNGLAIILFFANTMLAVLQERQKRREGGALHAA
ncbi:hypothetical protein ARMA_2097 [Ardenticatena maritima]|uniref:NnrS family protein n=1 Tax=Ardenticatena maritima TaxID=872965 RepID=A0A0M9UD63_9CHLR|nr:hypothetical protein [Ardenticatena maritima]KPL86964.1 hypothetical protein SE16_12920 [Ardenticatena maritima]GAP63674.1 hypothetical protein ARMA_2097 [Ardenticatena maritima]